MNDEHMHIGLLTASEGFLKSANTLNNGLQHLAAPLSVYYLFFHHVELALKSFIYLNEKKDKDKDKELKRIGVKREFGNYCTLVNSKLSAF